MYPLAILHAPPNLLPYPQLTIQQPTEFVNQPPNPFIASSTRQARPLWDAMWMSGDVLVQDLSLPPPPFVLVSTSNAPLPASLAPWHESSPLPLILSSSSLSLLVPTPVALASLTPPQSTQIPRIAFPFNSHPQSSHLSIITHVPPSFNDDSLSSFSLHRNS